MLTVLTRVLYSYRCNILKLNSNCDAEKGKAERVCNSIGMGDSP